MRTTITLEDDVFDQLRAEAAKTRRSFKDVLNQRLRQGLTANGRMSGTRFKVIPYKTSGFAPGVDAEHLNRLVLGEEDEAARR
jgi:hypothetical protein